ncbi:histidine phosphatase family protein [Sinorhizobium sp. BG8]|uniref:SixA phosphatase family protein n=1 Tax=Sinorhizobium sp. BG8 TaxID=2613773 RepID=UPI00193DA696|nr:histidine phosphatase family protein [Sinorhizobium sp. BG8]QRM53510.1 histidine phosphatase family protein [Sinorhizobium sp. BG8]
MPEQKKAKASKGPHRLILLRHAKSAWPDGVEDHDRPLALRGQKAARAMGAYMTRSNIVPDLVLVSTSRRTQETWDLVARELDNIHEVRRSVSKLYAAGADQLLSIVREIEPSYNTVMLIAHNPGLQDLAVRLVGECDPEVFERLREKFPTGALAIMEFEIRSWEEISPASGRLVQFTTPKSLARA